MKEPGTRQHRIRKGEEILLELLNPSLTQLGAERLDAHQDHLEASGAVGTNMYHIRQATALYCTIPAFGNYNITFHWRACQYFAGPLFRGPFGNRFAFLLNEKRVPDVELSGTNPYFGEMSY